MEMFESAFDVCGGLGRTAEPGCSQGCITGEKCIMQSLQRIINLYKSYQDLECVCYCIQTAGLCWGVPSIAVGDSRAEVLAGYEWPPPKPGGEGPCVFGGGGFLEPRACRSAVGSVVLSWCFGLRLSS